MSRRRYAVPMTATFLGVALLSGLPLARLDGQGTSVTADSLLRRLRALDTVLAGRTARVDSIRRAIVRPLPPVLVRAGAFNIRTTAALESRVTAAAKTASELVARRGGTVIAKRIAAHTPVVAPDSARAMFGILPVIALAPDTSRRWSPITRVTAPAGAGAAQLAEYVTMLAERFALEGADSVFASWVMVGRVPLRPVGTDELSDAYIELATTESVALRRCRDRDVASCLDVLGIDSLPGNRLDRWYAPEDYRALLRQVAPPGEDSTAVAAWIQCRRSFDRAACGTAARALPGERIPHPLSASLRFLFLREVLDAGGPGAYDRLLESPGTLRARFAAAAGEPAEATIGRWLSRVERARPERMRLTPALALSSLGWCGALICLALTRRGSCV